MRFKVERTVPNLRLHIALDGYLVASRGYGIYKSNDEGKTWERSGILPVPRIKVLLSKKRLISRALRLGISQIKQVFRNEFIVCCDKGLFIANSTLSNFNRINIPSRFFQLLDHSICATSQYVYLGEYIPNPLRKSVNIFRTTDGTHWEVVWSFPAKTIKHIHVLQYDVFTNTVWFSTGDADAECMVGFADLDFSNMHIIGQSSQKWRCLEFLFTEETVYWGVDTPLGKSDLLSYSRKEGVLKSIASFDNPIYNLRTLGSKGYIIVNAVERDKKQSDNKAHIWFSNNLYDWEDSIAFEKDSLPNILGFGRLLLPENTGGKLILSASALKKLDNAILVLIPGS